MRALVYVQHLLGIGHLTRAARIARAMVEVGFDVTFVSGGVPVVGVDVPGARLVQLPPLMTADDTFAQLVDDAGRAVDDAYKGRRREQLLAVFDETAPHVVLTEMYPFGRRQMRFEVEPLLERAIARTPRPIVAASVRDILVPRKPDRVAEMVARVRRYFDLVLVHGDPRLIGFGETFPRLADIEERVQYTGYVVDRPSAGAVARAGVGEGVVVSVGGGAVGARLLQAATAARPLSPLDRVAWHLLTGKKLPAEQFEALQAGAGSGVTVERTRVDFARLLANCRLSISQGGYNTVLEVLAARVPAVVVPYESEQATRCKALAARGLLQTLDAAALTPPALAAAMARALAAPLPAVDIDMNGAARTASLLRETAKSAQ